VDDEPTGPRGKCQETLEMLPGKRGTTAAHGKIASVVRGRDTATPWRTLLTTTGDRDTAGKPWCIRETRGRLAYFRLNRTPRVSENVAMDSGGEQTHAFLRGYERSYTRVYPPGAPERGLSCTSPHPSQSNKNFAGPR